MRLNLRVCVSPISKLLRNFFLLSCVLCARPALAQPQPTVAEIARELSCDCPDCGRQAVDQCMNTCATGKKYAAEIAAQLKQGKNKQQILNYFADTYGEHLLGNPRPRGVGRLAPIMPFLALLCGLIPVGFLLRRRSLAQARKRLPVTSADAKVAGAAPDDPRLAEALRDFDY
ncbi:MAG TPA: cytochrome c-type biogenesis protein CcmH [Abditibacteriaceae bacterium]|nr:cytochrome c-type biogenesis protein CcmH [Abditibacteriaceae bacterium]